jgi:hypothetical protein
MNAEYSEILGRFDRLENKLDAYLFGRPGSQENGLAFKVDRLMQAEGRRRWTLRLVIGAVLSMAVKHVYALFAH